MIAYFIFEKTNLLIFKQKVELKLRTYVSLLKKYQTKPKLYSNTSHKGQKLALFYSTC